MVSISVVIPTYNSEKSIQSTIQSVLNQTNTDWELIVIDDGSQDKTVEIISQINDPRIQILPYPNAGVSTSRNRGWEQAKGEFIAFLDHDDLWTSEKLESQLRALQEHPDAALAYSWTDHCDDSGNLIARGRHLSWTGNVYSKLLVDNFLDTASNPLIRKVALDEVGGFDPSINSSGEWDLWLRLAVRYPFVAVPESQVFHRISSSAMSAQIESHKRECLEVTERAFARSPASLQHLKKASQANIYKYLLCKSFEGKPTRQKGRQAFGLLWDYIRCEPESRSQFKFIVTMAIKSGVMAILPSTYAESVLLKLRRS
ncbi:glycosyltransferase [Lyngbya sp. CCY1209]|uniref:glycosyltransferase n=1 Tax=Lyngbya sp. CCY1209 TaxID=2886103 RepID=UPI002D212711|nr:glycosyltransferase [Lyngbya sp. CCY1209]MEB3885634.1 glycosyltransferase [Lyngbya sp. CCY1209]